MLGACSIDKHKHHNHHHKMPYWGNLVEVLEYIHHPRTISLLSKSCDIDLRKDKLKVAQFLEENRSSIENFRPSGIPALTSCRVVKTLNPLHITHCLSENRGTKSAEEDHKSDPNAYLTTTFLQEQLIEASLAQWKLRFTKTLKTILTIPKLSPLNFLKVIKKLDSWVCL